jgi:hypothetical protein
LLFSIQTGCGFLQDSVGLGCERPWNITLIAGLGFIQLYTVLFFGADLLSVLATGIPRFVSEHMNKDKYSPIWTRFLWAQLSYPGARYLSDDKPKYSVHETIVEFYRRAASLPAVNYVLTHKSGKLFCDACNKLQNEMVLSPDIGMRTAFDYAPGNLARLIGNCHIIHELAEGKDVPTSEISLSRVQQGVRLIYLFLEQLKQIYSY